MSYTEAEKTLNELENVNDNSRQPLLRNRSINSSIVKERVNIKRQGEIIHGTEYKVNINNLHLNNLNGDMETNVISTAKYTWFNVFPKILIEQFSKMANIYFLIIAIMQCINEISISNGKPVILLPLFVVVLINGVKDFLEDRKRKSSDDEENKKNCMILNTSLCRFETKTWSDVKIGNILMVREDEQFPADMIIINTSEKLAMCYIETKNLDGETNLKVRQGNGKLYENFTNERSLSQFEGTIECKRPNEFIYEFDAKIKSNILSEEFIIIDRNSFLLRGCSLKQTGFVYGIVVYVGHNTKIMKNSPKARNKISKMENTMNSQIIVIFMLQFTIATLASLLGVTWYTQNSALLDYIFPNLTSRYDYTNKFSFLFISRIGTWILIFTNFVPISLLVTLETIKLCQGFLVSWDKDIYDREKKTSTKVQTSTLNEELGQVQYIFSDKTGTLTKNYMEYRRMSIGTYIYGERGQTTKAKLSDVRGEITNVNFIETNEYKFNMHSRDELHDNYQNIHLFLECISLCHTAMIDAKQEVNNKIVYQASSPDEYCLVNAARYFGYVFISRDINQNLLLEIQGKELKYQILKILEYSSERKRMSVIVRCPDNKIRLFMKGADSVVREKISINKHLVPINESHLRQFAQDGLRTLMIAYREIDEADYILFEEKYHHAVGDIMKKDNLLLDLYEEVEKDLYLIGATAIDDQLQDDVGETLDILKKAGIKIWMLTGDKLDTAKSISFSCQLLSSDIEILEIPEKCQRTDISKLLKDKLKLMEEFPNLKYAVIVSTEQISLIYSDPILIEFFYELAIRCTAVVCCRVTPKQKAQMVNLIKEREQGATTLAIGDGANDVNMITTAHIGVGIIGVEGTQASRASDYSIAQFSFLRKLLLCHGREFYRKNSFVVCYNFYKNIIFVMPQFWFGLVSYFSGQPLYDPWIYQLFNIIFSSLPIVWFGIYDKEISFKVLFNEPNYYVQGIVNKLFHSIRFWKWILMGMLHGFILFIWMCFSMNIHNSEGRMQDLWSIGSAIYASIVVIVNLKLLFQTFSYNWVSVVLISLSYFSYWIILMIMSHYYRFENYGNSQMILSTFSFYGSYFLVTVLCLLLDIGVNKLLLVFNILKDGKDIKKNVDEKLKQNIAVTNKKLEDKIIRNTYYGEAFSQDKGQCPYNLRNITI